MKKNKIAAEGILFCVFSFAEGEVLSSPVGGTFSFLISDTENPYFLCIRRSLAFPVSLQ